MPCNLWSRKSNCEFSLPNPIRNFRFSNLYGIFNGLIYDYSSVEFHSNCKSFLNKDVKINDIYIHMRLIGYCLEMRLRNSLP